jgi:hypothetical protein
MRIVPFFSVCQSFRPFFLFFFSSFLGGREPTDGAASEASLGAQFRANMERDSGKVGAKFKVNMGLYFLPQFGANGKNDPNGCG